MKSYDVEAASPSLASLVKEAQSGEEVVIMSRNEPVARVIPLSANPRPVRKAGSLKGEVWIAPDFDAPLDDFREYSE